MSRRGFVMGSVVVAVLSAGCAPVAFAPSSGFNISMTRGLGFTATTCSPLGVSANASRMGIMPSAAIHSGMMRQNVAEIQSKYSAGASNLRQDMQSWKRVATGEC